MSIGPDPNATGAVRGDPRSHMAALPPDIRPETGPVKALPAHLRRTLVDYRTKEPAGTIIIDTQNTYLYLVLGNGKAMRYGVGVGREGFTWSGAEKVTKMAEWPDWNPPTEMIERQPYLPRFMAGGDGNPLGARALYLGKTIYRIHGTNQPSTIGTFVSSGCIRLTNEDVIDLYTRVKVGTRVVVLPGSRAAAAAAMSLAAARCQGRGVGVDAPPPVGRAGRAGSRPGRGEPASSRRRSCAQRGAADARGPQSTNRRARSHPSLQHAHRLAVEEAADIADHSVEIDPVVLRRHVAEMRREHDVVELAQRMVGGQRLDVEHVEAGAGDPLLAQRRSSAASSMIGPREVLIM